jgi:hypothetical protein
MYPSAGSDLRMRIRYWFPRLEVKCCLHLQGKRQCNRHLRNADSHILNYRMLYLIRPHINIRRRVKPTFHYIRISDLSKITVYSIHELHSVTSMGVSGALPNVGSDEK